MIRFGLVVVLADVGVSSLGRQMYLDQLSICTSLARRCASLD